MLILGKYSTSVIVKQYNLVAIISSGNQVARDFNKLSLHNSHLFHQLTVVQIPQRARKT